MCVLTPTLSVADADRCRCFEKASGWCGFVDVVHLTGGGGRKKTRCEYDVCRDVQQLSVPPTAREDSSCALVDPCCPPASLWCVLPSTYDDGSTSLVAPPPGWCAPVRGTESLATAVEVIFSLFAWSETNDAHLVPCAGRVFSPLFSCGRVSLCCWPECHRGTPSRQEIPWHSGSSWIRCVVWFETRTDLFKAK